MTEGRERFRSSSLKHSVSPSEISAGEVASTDELFFPVSGIPENGKQKNAKKKANTASRGEKNRTKLEKSNKAKKKDPSDGGGAPVIRTASLPDFLDEGGPFADRNSRQQDISGKH